MDKLVSIIVPIYNVETYLGQCLDSIINQTYKNLEIILIDDGSTDRSGKICNEYAKTEPRILVIHQQNAGAACAKNTGLDNMTGDYFTFADSDDYLEVHMIEELVLALERNHADIAECSFYYEYKNKSVIHKTVDEKSKIYNTKEYLCRYLTTWTCALLWNKIYKTVLSKDIRFPTERRCIDDEFYTYQLVLGTESVVSFSSPLYHYRKRESSVMTDIRNGAQIPRDRLRYLPERYEKVTRKYPQLKKQFLNYYMMELVGLIQNHPNDPVIVSRSCHLIRKQLFCSIYYRCGLHTTYYMIRELLRKGNGVKTDRNIEPKDDIGDLYD